MLCICNVFFTCFSRPGVSTTAGHDCLFEQSYPALLNHTLGTLFAAAGVQFEAINVAMGNTRVAPYSWCVDAHAGLDADIVSWDMSMMVAGNQCGRAATGVELFIRSASVLPKRPAVLLTDASPNQVRLVRTCDCLSCPPPSPLYSPIYCCVTSTFFCLSQLSALSCQTPTSIRWTRGVARCTYAPSEE